MLQYQSKIGVKKTLNCRGRILNLEDGIVMGILNITPDSFFDGGNYQAEKQQIDHVSKMLSEGASIIDIGAYSSRPGAEDISPEEELKRLLPAVKALVKEFPDAVFSVDTFRPEVAKEVLASGVHIINDISGGAGGNKMYSIAADAKAPYIIMHMQGTPSNMQIAPKYNDVALEVLEFLKKRASEAIKAGVNDVIIDPGFGFGKDLGHNYELLNKLHLFCTTGYPVLAGVSRKSMINKVLNTKPENALNGTSIVNTIAALQGCSILRVHDVKEAVQVLKIVNELEKHSGK